MGLTNYFKKRKFDKTPEPKGEQKAAPSKKLAFVVQEHHATALHYDFRLELDGVLKSWAVPKGPSLNPHDHHLAIMTEDHPFEYRKFEGVIPEGNYGAGNVIIWDKGWYEPRESTDDQTKALRKGLKKGHLTFILHGEKLHGEFALIKLHDGDKNWLLIKKGDEFASKTDVTAQDKSVISERAVDELGARNKLPDLSKYPKIAKPWTVKPMLCTLVDEPFSRDDWFFEVKWDGFRAIASKHGQNYQLYSRNKLDFREDYQPVVEALRACKHDVIVDGELVVVDADGRPHFEWMHAWQQQGTLLYYIFDILWCDGHDVRQMTLRQRKALLHAVMPKDPILRYSDHVEAKGEQLFRQMQKQHLEGMVAKRADSVYNEGERGEKWLKIKTHQRQEVVIGGYTEPRGSREYLGALLVGVYERGELVYVGHSGGGIADKERKKLWHRLQKLERRTSPFKSQPKPNAPVHWVKPEVVCEMSFSEWTPDGHMRHPQFKGLREDKKPSNIRKEKPREAKPVIKKADQPELTHLDKVFFPKAKYTKGDLVEYYRSVAAYIVPYLKGRACSMNRMPNGIGGESFFQKNNEHLPDWVSHANIFSDSHKGNLHWIVGDTLADLLYMVQLGCIEINPWNSQVKTLNNPDWIVIDLDPEGIGFDKVIQIAKTVHEVCEEWKIPAYPKTSGKTGIHIFIPMHAKYDYDQAKNLAHLIALEVNRRQPDITSVERLPKKRPHKIYLDFLQNRPGQTLAAPYSVRPTPTATVSMPLEWHEVKAGLDPTDFTIANALSRLKKKGDIWKPVLGKGIDLVATLKRIEKTQGS